VALVDVDSFSEQASAFNNISGAKRLERERSLSHLIGIFFFDEQSLQG
jgi:hypothetical protein